MEIRALPAIRPGRFLDMRILLSNDDGYFAPGIAHLAQTLQGLADITVVAPERDRSGASNSLTLDRPLSLRQTPNGFYHVNGTPTDCGTLQSPACSTPCPTWSCRESITAPTWAMTQSIQARLLPPPRAICSACRRSPCRWLAKGRAFRNRGRGGEATGRAIPSRPITHPMLLNVNVPDIPANQIRGVRVTRPVVGTRPNLSCARPRRGRNRVLDRRRGRSGRRRRGHRFSCGREQLRVGDSAADRSDAYRTAVDDGSLAEIMAHGVTGIGMTSQRTRARMIERLRERRTRRGGSGGDGRGAASCVHRGGARPSDLRGYRLCLLAWGRPSRSRTSWRG